MASEAEEVTADGASTLVLLMTGLLCLFGILYLRRRREREV